MQMRLRVRGEVCKFEISSPFSDSPFLGVDYFCLRMAHITTDLETHYAAEGFIFFPRKVVLRFHRRVARLKNFCSSVP